MALSAALPAGCTCNRDSTGTSSRASGKASDKAAAEPTGVDLFYALEILPTFDITLDDQAIARLKDKPRKYVRGAFAYDGVTYEDVGVRLKGHRSMRPIDDKPSFKLRFDKYVDDAAFFDQRELTLNNLVEDPTMMRELLGYNLLRAMGVPSPKVGYARVRVNGQPYGLYALIETVDERFLARNFSDPSGNLYEGEYGCDMFEDDVEGFEHDAGEDESRADLRALTATVAATEAGDADHLFDRESSPLHMDAFLGYLAGSAFLGDFDGYRHSHNYRVYHHPADGKWYFVPWGIDRTFKKSLSIYDSQGLLAKMCFADPACRLEYVRTLKELVERFESLHLDDGVRVISAFIDQAAAEDPRKSYSVDKIRDARAQLLDFIAKRPAEVREQLTCIDDAGSELDRDGDGYGCMDCDDADPAVRPGAAEVCDGLDNDCSGLIDDSPACPCPTVDIEGVTFHLCDQPMPWVDAAAYCRAKGLSLARIDSAEQSRALRRAASRYNDERWWLGLSDRDQEGAFHWQDGAAVEWAYWARKQPDNDGCNQDCGALKKDGEGTWHDTHCGQHRPFICR